MELERNESWKRGVSTGFLLFFLLILAMLLKAYLDGRFHSADTLREYIRGFGIFAPLVLTFFQAMQVVIPVVPGFFGCAAGAALFGCAGGFWCNYIGISTGSVAAFFLARRYGVSLVKALFSEEQYDKWSSWIGRSRSFSALLFAAILLPLFPDDFLCYFSGLTKMSKRKFIGIIALGKPWCILAYSMLFSGIFERGF